MQCLRGLVGHRQPINSYRADIAPPGRRAEPHDKRRNIDIKILAHIPFRSPFAKYVYTMAPDRIFTPGKEDIVEFSADVSLSLVTMPVEIILHILCFLDTLSLFRIECVCSYLGLLARKAYRASYGPGPLHRVCDPVDFRALAIEQLRFVRSGEAEDRPSDEQTLWLLERCYHFPDKELYDVATDALLILQRLSDRDTDAWNEAVATALMAQGRHVEAGEYYKRMEESGHSLPERTVLTAARWSWPFTLPLPDATYRTSLKALIGAALRGDESILKDWHNRGGSLDVVVDYDSPANAAARAGHIHILQFLRDTGINLVEPPQRGDSALYDAAKYGQVSAAQFLLGVGADPHIPVDNSPADIAARTGQVGILRLFKQHTPMLTTARMTKGGLRIEPAIRLGRIAVIRAFAEVFDINGTDEAGQTAFHLAVDSERKEVVEAVITSGANIHMSDACGQTAFERAVSRNNPIVGWLSQRIGHSPTGLREYKQTLAEKILVSERELRLQRLAGLHRLEERLVHSRWLAERMDEKLLGLWVSSMSTAALAWYVEVILASTIGATYYKVNNLAHNIINSAGDVPIDEEDQGGMSLASDVATAVMPPLGESRNIARVALGIEREVPTEDLRVLRTQLFSPWGRMYNEGRNAKFVEEMMAVDGFISRLKRSIDVSAGRF